MTDQQMITALIAALQTQDSNGEFANVMLVMQAILIKNLPNLLTIQLQNMCTVLSIDYTTPPPS